MKKLKIPIIILIIILIVAFGFSKLNKKEKVDYSNYPTTEIKEGEFIVTIEEVGIIKAVKTKSIQAPFRGKISKLLDDGTKVEEGETVIWLDTDEIQKEIDNKFSYLESRKKDLEAKIEGLEMGIRNNTLDVNSAKAELEFAKLKLEEVERDLDTKKALLEADLISRRDIKSAEINYHGSELDKDKNEYKYIRTVKNKTSDEKIKKAQMDDVNIRIDQSEKELTDAKEKLIQAEIKAPASGLFLLTNRWNWQNQRREPVKAGDSVHRRQEIATIPDLSQLIVKTQIGESEVYKINKETTVEMDVDAIPGLKLNGKVTNIGAIAIRRFSSEGAGIVSSNVEFHDAKVFEVTVPLDEIDDRLKPGMTVNVSYIIEKVDNVKHLPIKSVFDEKGKKYVYKVKKNGYEKIEVETDEKNRTDVVVITDLPPGTTVFSKKPKEEENKKKAQKS